MILMGYFSVRSASVGTARSSKAAAVSRTPPAAHAPSPGLGLMIDFFCCFCRQLLKKTKENLNLEPKKIGFAWLCLRREIRR